VVYGYTDLPDATGITMWSVTNSESNRSASAFSASLRTTSILARGPRPGSENPNSTTVLRDVRGFPGTRRPIWYH